MFKYIQTYLVVPKSTNKYPIIFVLGNGTNTNNNQGPFYQNIQIFKYSNICDNPCPSTQASENLLYCSTLATELELYDPIVCWPLKLQLNNKIGQLPLKLDLPCKLQLNYTVVHWLLKLVQQIIIQYNGHLIYALPILQYTWHLN